MRAQPQKWLLRGIAVAALAYICVMFVWASGSITGSTQQQNAGGKELSSGASIAGLTQSGVVLQTHVSEDGRQPCTDCHEKAVQAFQRTAHGHVLGGKDDALVCGSCHEGNLAEHSNDTSTLVIAKIKKSAPIEINAKCLSCHSKADDRAHTSLSEHTIAGVSCISCHNMHPAEDDQVKMAARGIAASIRGKSTDLCIGCHQSKAVEFSQTTHHRLKEGIMECTTCHNPHGSDEGKLLRADRKEVCVQCHQDKRGPFAFEHGGVLNEKGCVTCHEPHGGGAIHMLKARDPKTLCMSCHAKEAIGMHGVSGMQYNGSVPVSGLTSAGDCTRCHAEIHGSNSTPFLHR